jgi:hypothetical protein
VANRHFVYELEGDRRATKCRSSGDGSQLGGVDIAKCAAIAADRRTGGTHDEDR